MTSPAERPHPHRASLRPARRTALLAGGAGALAATAAACGPLRVGQPATYTPPPAGIDDLYRTDLLSALDGAIGACTGATDLDAAQPELAAHLLTALHEQRAALLTGAEAEAASEDPAAASDGGGDPSAAGPDAAALITALVALRDLCTQAARQVSGSLARPVAAIGASAAWSSARLATLLPQTATALTALPAPEDIVPAREVPESDPPSIGAEVDFHGTVETAQADEWYVGYVHEVLAARTDGAERETHLASSAEHRARAEQLAEIARAEEAPVVTREAVYPLPSSFADPAGVEAWPAEAAHDLLVTHLALVGAAPFADRPVPIAAALAEGAALGPLSAALEALPSLGE